MEINNTNKIQVSTEKEILSNPAFSSVKMINPRRDWTILVGLFVIFVIGVIAFDYRMYKKTVSGDMYVSVKRDELIVEDLKVSNIKDVLSTFENKKNIINTLKLEKVSDPSL
jgi:hypothetical protein